MPNKLKLAGYILSLIFVLLFLSACSRNDSDIIESNQNPNTHLVDERFELISLVLRLAGEHMASDTVTDFHRKLDYTFSGFSEHHAVRHAGLYLRLRAWLALNIAIHLQKIDGSFVLVENTENLGMGARNLTCDSIESFVRDLNDFYHDTNFAAFFQEHYEYFWEHSERFRREVLDQINFDWFRQHGLNPGNMRTIISPTYSNHGFAAWQHGESLNEKIIYAAVTTSASYCFNDIGICYIQWVVHEFVHAFANPIADIWLIENSDFRTWSISTHASGHTASHYINSIQYVAHEYVTRAYTILYMIENTEANLFELMVWEMFQGYRHIQEVYALITHHEFFDFSVSGLLGVDEYYLSELITTDVDDNAISWQFIDLRGHELVKDNLKPMGIHYIFGSQTGQALYVFYHGFKYLFIDLGPAEQFEEFYWHTEFDEARAYFMMLIF